MESVRFCQKKKGLEVGAWCIMTSHVHMILGNNGAMKIENTIRDLKSFTPRHIRKELESSATESRKEWLLWMMKRS